MGVTRGRSGTRQSPAGLARRQSLRGDQAGCPPWEEGPRRLQHRLAQDQDPFPEACRCGEADAEACLNLWQVPARPRQEVRTSHLAERACAEERRRTKVIPPLWDEASGVKLVFAVMIRVRERWGKKPWSAFEQHQMRALRQA